MPAIQNGTYKRPYGGKKPSNSAYAPYNKGDKRPKQPKPCPFPKKG